MQNTIDLKEVSKDHYQLFLNGSNAGVWERSDLRHLIEVIDNTI